MNNWTLCRVLRWRKNIWGFLLKPFNKSKILIFIVFIFKLYYKFFKRIIQCNIIIFSPLPRPIHNTCIHTFSRTFYSDELLTMDVTGWFSLRPPSWTCKWLPSGYLFSWSLCTHAFLVSLSVSYSPLPIRAQNPIELGPTLKISLNWTLIKRLTMLSSSTHSLGW